MIKAEDVARSFFDRVNTEREEAGDYPILWVMEEEKFWDNIDIFDSITDYEKRMETINQFMSLVFAYKFMRARWEDFISDLKLKQKTNISIKKNYIDAAKKAKDFELRKEFEELAADIDTPIMATGRKLTKSVLSGFIKYVFGEVSAKGKALVDSI